ncbi:MAG: hypothetical protein SGBAC_009639 [Bacillariaceae sp.]
MSSTQQQLFRFRISGVMTVRQLQGECRHRGLKKFSGKSKAWLLDQLGAGTVWQSCPSSTITETSASAKTMAKKRPAAKPPSHKVTEKEAPKLKRPPAGTKNFPAAKPKATAASIKKVTKKEAPPPKKRTIPDGSTANSLSDFLSDSPRITSKMTKPQLSHETLETRFIGSRTVRETQGLVPFQTG